MIIIESNTGENYMQGEQTTLADNETLQHNRQEGDTVLCEFCSQPFIVSLQKNGVLSGTKTVLCSCCEKRIAYVVKTD